MKIASGNSSPRGHREFSTIEPLEDRIAPATLIVTNTSDSASTPGSLRAAITQLDLPHTGLDTIVFHLPASPSPAVITLGSVLDITNPVTITGPGVNKLIISGGNATQLFNITSPSTITGLALVDGNAQGANGGAIASTASLTLNHCLISGNTTGSSAFGGGVYVKAKSAGSTINISNTVITGNYAAFGGGGADLYASKGVTLSSCVISGNSGAGVVAKVPASATGGIVVGGCSFIGNQAGQTGGAGGLFLVIATIAGPAKAKASISGSLFAGNSGSVGGALETFIESGSLAIQSSVFRNNTAAVGSGLYLSNQSATPITISSSKITGNSATDPTGAGGGINLAGGSFTITASQITDNTSAGAGGGIGAEIRAGSLTLSASIVDGNHAAKTGGGIDISAGVVAKITGGSISNNSAGTDGGGLAELSTGALTITGTHVLGNTSHGDGGGICVDFESDDTVHLIAVTVADNINGVFGDHKGGGGIELDGAGSFTLSGTVIDNTSFGDAGGIQINGSRTGAITATVAGNVATFEGGGIGAFGSGTVTDIPALVFGNFAPTDPNTFGI